MKRNAFTWWQAMLILAGLAMLAAILFPVFGRRKGSQRDYCQSNLKQIALGIKQYMQDYDEKYPLVNSGKQGWVDIIQPYIKSMQLSNAPKRVREAPKAPPITSTTRAWPDRTKLN